MRRTPRTFFPDFLIVTHRGEGQWKLHCDFRYGRIKMPLGFRTDLISVPAVFRAFISPCGPDVEAAVLHDYLLSRGVRWAIAAAFFREALRHSGISWARALVAWAGVMAWGFVKGKR